MEAPNERHTLALLQAASADVDPILSSAAGQEIKRVDQRHLFERNRSEGEADVQYGDPLPPGFHISGPGHSYKENVATGKSRVQYGDRVNGPGVFNEP